MYIRWRKVDFLECSFCGCCFFRLYSCVQKVCQCDKGLKYNYAEKFLPFWKIKISTLVSLLMEEIKNRKEYRLESDFTRVMVLLFFLEYEKYDRMKHKLFDFMMMIFVGRYKWILESQLTILLMLVCFHFSFLWASASRYAKSGRTFLGTQSVLNSGESN